MADSREVSQVKVFKVALSNRTHDGRRHLQCKIQYGSRRPGSFRVSMSAAVGQSRGNIISLDLCFKPHLLSEGQCPTMDTR
jgi:hypothetical protein